MDVGLLCLIGPPFTKGLKPVVIERPDGGLHQAFSESAIPNFNDSCGGLRQKFNSARLQNFI
jgi:hypothetical protein